jgi:hypothetical protein
MANGNVALQRPVNLGALNVNRPMTAATRLNNEIVTNDIALDIPADLYAAPIADFALQDSICIDEEYTVPIVHWISPF